MPLYMIGNPLSLEHFLPAENDIDSLYCKINYFVFFLGNPLVFF